jgi:two-component system response regulator NreC
VPDDARPRARRLIPRRRAGRASARGLQRPAVDDLTDREREVLGLLALGHTNREIAEQLVLSVRTVESHRARIQRKLAITSRAELVKHAVDRDLLKFAPPAA